MSVTKKARRSDSLYFDNSRMPRRTLCDMVAQLEEDKRELQTKNALLRELVCHMHECMSNVDADGNHECFACEYENAECEFDRRMRELGVDVS